MFGGTIRRSARPWLRCAFSETSLEVASAARLARNADPDGSCLRTSDSGHESLDVFAERGGCATHRFRVTLDVEDREDVELETATGEAEQVGHGRGRPSGLALDDILDVTSVLGTGLRRPVRTH